MPETKSVFYDRLEVRSAADRDTSLTTALPGFLHQAVENAPAIARQLDGIDLTAINSFQALSSLPILRKSELIERQQAALPFGGLNGTPIGRLAKIFVSPGLFTNLKGRDRITGALPAPCSLQVFAPATSCTIPLPIT